MTKSFAPAHSIVIIGGGFAGTVAAIKLLDTARAPLAITVIEDRPELGRGVAYSTREDVHLVNGPARIFGLHPERPEHLVDWLRQNGPAHGWTLPDDVHDSSPTRWLYGTYVQSELQRAIGEAKDHSTLVHIRDRAVSLRSDGARAIVETSRSETVIADRAVLALGVFQGAAPASEQSVAGHAAFAATPWNSSQLDSLARSQHVLIIGSSLSMIDTVASLEARGFTGHYTIVSRRGQVVERRRNAAPGWDFLGEGGLPTSARDLLARVKAERRRLAAHGEDWQALPLAIRPHLLRMWQGASNQERGRFARHLRGFWDVTAHRAAPESYGALETARVAGRVTSAAGRVLSLSPRGDKIAAEIRWRGDGREEVLVFDGVINCRGHQLHDWHRIGDPFVRSLIAGGVVRAHATGFGIDATADGQVIGHDGAPSQQLFAIGHPLRGVAWESSSIGEQLAQAIALTGRLQNPAVAEVEAAQNEPGCAAPEGLRKHALF